MGIPWYGVKTMSIYDKHLENEGGNSKRSDSD